MTTFIRSVVLFLLCVWNSVCVGAQGSPLSTMLGMGRSTNQAPSVCEIVSPASWPDVTEGVTVPTVTIQTANCQAPVTCTLSSGALPTGITESAECVYSDDAGAAHSAGTTNITVRATANNGAISDRPYSIVIGAAGSGLPAGWESGDVGSQGLGGAGTVTYDDNGSAGATVEDIWTLTSTAPNILNNSDNFRYACTTNDNDGYIEAEVTSLTGYQFAQAGVMIRQSLTSTSTHVFNHIYPAGNGNSNQRKYRAIDAGNTTNEGTGSSSHFWLRVIREGDVFTSYISTTGAIGSWVSAASSVTIDMTTTAYYCLAVTSILNQETVADVDFTNVTVSDSPPVDPGEDGADFGGLRPVYQGFGYDSLGGAGDTTRNICVVTSAAATTGAPTSISGGALASDAHSTTVAHHHGTLRQCIDTNNGGYNASYVVFDVSGYIEMGGQIYIDDPYLTVAGQTAPAPVALRNGFIWVEHRDMAFQHLRFRCAAAQGTNAAFGFRGQNNPVFNIVLDHVSISWCGYEAAGTSTLPNPIGSGTNTVRAQDILIVDSMFSEMLAISSSRSICFLTFGADNGSITFARNYFSCANRNPWIGAGYRAALINNLQYNAHGPAGGDGKFGFVQVVGEPNYPTSLIEMVYWGNVAIAGPDSTNIDGTIGVHMSSNQVAAGGAEIYLADNTGPSITGTTQEGQWAGVDFLNAATRNNSECNQTCFDNTTTLQWFKDVNYQILPNAQVKAFVQANAGGWPTSRDALDTRLLGDPDDGGGSNTLTNESQVGGFAAVPLTTTTVAYQIPNNPHNAGSCGTKASGVARTILECDLETKARAREPRWTP